MSNDFPPDRARARVATILIALALATTALAAGSHYIMRGASGEKTVSGKVFPGFAQDMPQVRVISVTGKGITYDLLRSGDSWIMPQRDNYPVSQTALSQLAKALSDLAYKSARTSDPERFAKLGVDDSKMEGGGALITVKGATNQILHDVHIGQKADAIFVRNAGKNTVFEASGTLPDFTNVAAWLDLKVLDVVPENIATVSGQRQGDRGYEIVRRPDGGFAPVGGQANVTATTTAIALTKWAPIDVMAASRLKGDPIANHITTLKDGSSILLAAYVEPNGSDWVVVSAIGADQMPASDRDARVALMNQKTDGWAFQLSPTDFSDVTFSYDAVVNGPR